MVKESKIERKPPRPGRRGKYKKKRVHEYEVDRHSRRAKARIEGGFSLASHKPSYGLIQGTGDRTERGVHNESIGSDHRKRLWRLLNHLMRRHNWTEATGVLAVLLQGTVNDRLPSTNRAKFTAALELLNFINDQTVSSESVQSVHELWIKKVGPLKYWSPKNMFAVQLEIIMSCFQRGAPEDALDAVRHLMKERSFPEDPVSRLVAGLAFYQLWYSTSIPEKLQLTDLNSSGTYVQPESPTDSIYASYNNSVESDAPERGTDSSIKGCSNTYVMDEEAFVDVDNQQKESKDNNVTARIETSHSDAQPQEFSVFSAEGSEDSDDSLPNSDDLLHASIFCTQDLPPWLLPLKLPDSHESLDDAISTHKSLRTYNYECALKHLRAALKSEPPVLEAFHPLLQMLLLGDQVCEALKLFEEEWFDSSDNILLLRLKATVLEHFVSGNHVKIYENILKKDPTCKDSLGRLIHMHHRGDYDTLNLVEMIALHLDATHGACDAWKELASCLFKLSQCEGNVSTCHDGSDRHSPEYLDNSSKIPELFVNSDSANTWRFRCRWWLNRHFPNKILLSDIASGDLELLTYKASTASHFYGRCFNYVVKATECLEKENNMELYSFLQMHSLSSIGFYSAKMNTC